LKIRTSFKPTWGNSNCSDNWKTIHTNTISSCNTSSLDCVWSTNRYRDARITIRSTFGLSNIWLTSRMSIYLCINISGIRTLSQSTKIIRKYAKSICSWRITGNLSQICWTYTLFYTFSRQILSKSLYHL